MGMVLKGSRRMERTATDELGEDSDVILEVGFDGKCLDLLELSERSPMGLERQRRRGYYCVGFWRRRRRKWADLESVSCCHLCWLCCVCVTERLCRERLVKFTW